MNQPVLHLAFSLVGKTIPADHGYRLYSAIKKTLGEPELPKEVSISTVVGTSTGEGYLWLQKWSRLRFRFPADQVQRWYQLQGQVLDLNGHLIRLVQPQLYLPQPATSLRARIVVIKLKDWDEASAPRYFLESCQRGLEALSIKGEVWIPSTANGDLARKSLRIKDKHVLGYSVQVDQLSPEDSLRLQDVGLGGRQHFGAGWFHPIRQEAI
ncbi:type I-MYXAN CRISPR-associated protein Cas6/Cmx6 [Synechococcus elongatus]|uniref:type I-MYXAN CRISPR-associated protein Cas6/Cmx6 n=1 Tax=Synechococcus elongatus TaxID=32046 RepID=UPI000F7F78A2|nr:type I-MYXAN CRISPR-associated protein Cas6/Cmx6 [Synechococcus elongatus]